MFDVCILPFNIKNLVILYSNWSRAVQIILLVLLWFASLRRKRFHIFTSCSFARELRIWILARFHSHILMGSIIHELWKANIAGSFSLQFNFFWSLLFTLSMQFTVDPYFLWFEDVQPSIDCIEEDCSFHFYFNSKVRLWYCSYEIDRDMLNDLSSLLHLVVLPAPVFSLLV